MARARSARAEQIRAYLDKCVESGYPRELLELFRSLRAEFDNADNLRRLFGVVDEGSVERAWALYNEFMGLAEKKRPTLH